jgi:hypothetical protein
VIYSIMSSSMTMSQIMEQLADAMKRLLADFLAELIVSALKSLLIGKLLVAMTTPYAVAMAKMWAAPAALASTATFGGAAVVGGSMLASTMAMIQSLAVAMSSAGGVGAGGPSPGIGVGAGGGALVAQEGLYVEKDSMVRVGEAGEPEIILPVHKMRKLVNAIMESIVTGTPVESPREVRFIPREVIASLAESAKAVTMESGAQYGGFVRAVSQPQPSMQGVTRKEAGATGFEAAILRALQQVRDPNTQSRGIIEVGEIGREAERQPPVVNFTNYGDINSGHDLDQLVERVERSVVEAMKA